MLEISIDASAFKIKRAYKNAVELHGKKSLLTYSLFSEEERINILKRLEDAYHTLIDKTRRRAYNASLRGESRGIEDGAKGIADFVD